MFFSNGHVRGTISSKQARAIFDFNLSLVAFSGQAARMWSKPSDKIGFCQTSCYVQSVRPFIVELQPSLQIAKTCQCVVAKHVSAILIRTASSLKLRTHPSVVPEERIVGLTYSGDKTRYMGPDLRALQHPSYHLLIPCLAGCCSGVGFRNSTEKLSSLHGCSTGDANATRIPSSYHCRGSLSQERNIISLINLGEKLQYRTSDL